MSDDSLPTLRRRLARRHHLFGWCGVLVFLTLGAALEVLHGFKIGFYLDPGSKLRREMWTLAHAHGTLLGLLNVAFAAGLPALGSWGAAGLRVASFLLLDATALIPLGFFLGGLSPTESDPSAGVLLVPLGAVLLFAAVALVVASALRDRGSEVKEVPPP